MIESNQLTYQNRSSEEIMRQILLVANDLDFPFLMEKERITVLVALLREQVTLEKANLQPKIFEKHIHHFNTKPCSSCGCSEMLCGFNGSHGSCCTDQE